MRRANGKMLNFNESPWEASNNLLKKIERYFKKKQ